jgi:hypothetical protein
MSFVQIKPVRALVTAKEKIGQPVVVDITGPDPSAIVEIAEGVHVELFGEPEIVGKSDPR